MEFSSDQTFDVDPSEGAPDIQNARQVRTVDASTTTREPWHEKVGSEADVGILSNHVHSTDTLQYDSSFNFLDNTGSNTWQTYAQKDSRGQYYSRKLTADAQVLASVGD